MNKQMNRTALTAAALALAAMLAGCGSDGGSAATSSATATSSSAETSTSSAAPETSATASGPEQTVAEYLQANGITMTPVKRGEAGTPQLNLPIPAGWADVGGDTPQDAWGAIALEDAADAANPAAIVARMARLTGGEIDQAKILELAPNAVRNQPGYEGPAAGQPAKLAGFDATEIAGTVVQDGQPAFVARKTVVIPGQDATYLLALDAQGSPDEQEALGQAMAAIDAETTIEP